VSNARNRNWTYEHERYMRARHQATRHKRVSATVMGVAPSPPECIACRCGYIVCSKTGPCAPKQAVQPVAADGDCKCGHAGCSICDCAPSEAEPRIMFGGASRFGKADANRKAVAQLRAEGKTVGVVLPRQPAPEQPGELPDGCDVWESGEYGDLWCWRAPNAVWDRPGSDPKGNDRKPSRAEAEQACRDAVAQLEKPAEPRFKVGDRVVARVGVPARYLVATVEWQRDDGPWHVRVGSDVYPSNLLHTEPPDGYVVRQLVSINRWGWGTFSYMALSDEWKNTRIEAVLACWQHQAQQAKPAPAFADDVPPGWVLHEWGAIEHASKAWVQSSIKHDGKWFACESGGDVFRDNVPTRDEACCEALGLRIVESLRAHGIFVCDISGTTRVMGDSRVNCARLALSEHHKLTSGGGA